MGYGKSEPIAYRSFDFLFAVYRGLSTEFLAIISSLLPLHFVAAKISGTDNLRRERKRTEESDSVSPPSTTVQSLSQHLIPAIL
jgi:hypothetical protein